MHGARFSHDGKTLAFWFGTQLALLDGNNGQEFCRVPINVASVGTPVPYVAFDSADQYCCIARRWRQPDAQEDGFEIVLIDVRRCVASESFAQAFAFDWEDDDFDFESTSSPLRQILCVEVQEAPLANCEVVFPASGEQPAKRISLDVSLLGNRECQQLAEADRAFQAIADAEH